MRISVPLRLQIYQTDSAFQEATLIFDGAVRKPELNGRRVQVKCNEWGDAMEQRVPGFFIQRECNYRVYDSKTCRADKASKQVAVTLTVKAGRSVRANGAGLAGLAASWFAQGWLETGTGLNREVRFILDSTAAAGNDVILTLSQALSAEVPIAATMTRGCDGLRSTCIAVFDNLVNFGGHAPSRQNLTLTAIKTNTKTGGKK
jgi:uncharacterized phage protein (TIGR02218 family)